MIEYLLQHLWLIWAIVAAICLIIELGAGDFFVTCFAIGALCAMLTTFVGFPVWLQILVFAVGSVLSIMFIRPSLLRHLHAGGDERASNADALIGRIGQVIEPIEVGGSGYVRIDGDEWKAVSKASEPIRQGEKVKVVAMESIIVTVERV